jgi:DNA replication protein DnaC
MQLNHQLVPKLKNLRLSGSLATLDVRTQQAITEKLSYVDFLERLVEDEVERRGQTQLQLRLRRATVDLGKTLEGFDFSFNPSINRQQIFDLATGHFIERHETVLIQGPAGVGKSHLAQALGHEACRRGFDVVFVSAARMLGHLHGGRADGTYERRLLTYTRPDLLILDDFGLKPLPPAGPEDFYEVINERYEHGAVIVTSNRAFTEWPELFQSPLLASATLDRLAHHGGCFSVRLSPRVRSPLVCQEQRRSRRYVVVRARREHEDMTAYRADSGGCRCGPVRLRYALRGRPCAPGFRPGLRGVSAPPPLQHGNGRSVSGSRCHRQAQRQRGQIRCGSSLLAQSSCPCVHLHGLPQWRGCGRGQPPRHDPSDGRVAGAVPGHIVARARAESTRLRNRFPHAHGVRPVAGR